VDAGLQLVDLLVANPDFLVDQIKVTGVARLVMKKRKKREKKIISLMGKFGTIKGRQDKFSGLNNFRIFKPRRAGND
jgi:hypothetical protein